MYESSLKQYAVGKGSFTSVTISEIGKGRVFSYAYDCGSLSLPTLRRELKDFKTEFGPEHDALIISHFDFDHYSGLEILNEIKINFKYIFLPMFDYRELILHLCKIPRAADRNRLLDTLQSLSRKIVYINKDFDTADTDFRFSQENTFSRELKVSRRQSSNDGNSKYGISIENSVWQLHIVESRTTNLDKFLRKQFRDSSVMQKALTAVENKQFSTLKELIKELKTTVNNGAPNYDFNNGGLVAVSSPTSLRSIYLGIRDDHFPMRNGRISCGSFLHVGDINLSKGDICNEVIGLISSVPLQPSYVQITHHGSIRSHSNQFYQSLANVPFMPPLPSEMIKHLEARGYVGIRYRDVLFGIQANRKCGGHFPSKNVILNLLKFSPHVEVSTADPKTQITAKFAWG